MARSLVQYSKAIHKVKRKHVVVKFVSRDRELLTHKRIIEEINKLI
ncbi:MAG: hypothetical protein QXK54_00655 [Ignisphaera sp.]